MAERRRVWVETRQSDMANMLETLIFIDETSLKTNLVKSTGWAPVGKRLVDHAPFGHWHTQTPDQVRGKLFIAGLAHDGLIAPWVLDGAMNRDSFEAYIARELAPAVRPDRSSWPTTCRPTNPAAPSSCCAPKAMTSYSVLVEIRPLDGFLFPRTPIRPILTPSKWRSPRSKPFVGKLIPRINF